MSKRKLTSVNVLGVKNKVVYDPECPSEKGEWGSYTEVDRLISIHDTPDDFERWHILIHEVMHVIEAKLALTSLKGPKGHKELDLFAYGLTDFLFRNKLLKDR